MDLRALSVKELENIWQEKRDELFTIKKILDEKKGDLPPETEVNFESYVTY